MLYVGLSHQVRVVAPMAPPRRNGVLTGGKVMSFDCKPFTRGEIIQMMNRRNEPNWPRHESARFGRSGPSQWRDVLESATQRIWQNEPNFDVKDFKNESYRKKCQKLLPDGRQVPRMDGVGGGGGLSSVFGRLTVRQSWSCLAK